jgi:hypothetical protein
MQYNYSLQIWPHYVLSISKYYLNKTFSFGILFTLNLLNTHTQDCHLFLLISFRKPLNVSLKQQLQLAELSQPRLSRLSSLTLWLFKVSFTLVPLLLTCVANAKMLSASTSNIIEGTAPYLTFDGGITKATQTDGLLSIKLSDATVISPMSNTSSLSKPIVLPSASDTFANVLMFLPTTRNSISLNTLVRAPYNYWGDNDGDGQGRRGITATGRLRVRIKDKNNRTVSRVDILDICNAPYKMELSNTNGSLKTRYGVPNQTIFGVDAVTYYFTPESSAKVCYAKPELQESIGRYAGPAEMWDTRKGFIPQATTPSSYASNFPTTGANGLYFDLDIGGRGSLTWPSITQGGITATMTPDANGTTVRVTLTGPASTKNEQNADLPGPLQAGIPNLPQIFELKGYDSSGKEVVKYGFELKKWFVNRGLRTAEAANQEAWCSSIGYRIIQVKDVTNATCDGSSSCQNAVGATPSSRGNNYHRRIGGGLFSEWARLANYSGSGFSNLSYWTSDVTGERLFHVYSYNGRVYRADPIGNYYGVCVYP